MKMHVACARAALVQLALGILLLHSPFASAQSVFDSLKKSLQQLQEPASSKGTSSTKAAVGPQPLPSTSKASVEVIDIKLGTSSLADVRAIREKAGPKPSGREFTAILQGNRSGQRTVDLTNTQHVASLYWIINSRHPNRQAHCRPVEVEERKIDCEHVEVGFSTPPNQGIAIWVDRYLYLANGPTFDNFSKSLIEKYGKPSQVVSNTSDGGRVMNWAWTVEGTVMPLTGTGPCTYENTPIRLSVAPTSTPGSQLRVGCAVVLNVHFTGQNSVVNYIKMQAIDFFRAYKFNEATIKAIDGLMAKIDEAERDKASKATTPKL